MKTSGRGQSTSSSTDTIVLTPVTESIPPPDSLPVDASHSEANNHTQLPRVVPAEPNERRTDPTNARRNPLSPSGSNNGFSARSNLDIYAHKYVPYWLKAVNESPAVPVYSPLLQRVDFEAYQSAFTPHIFSSSLPPIQLPPTDSCPIFTDSCEPSTYEPFWKERLHNEYAAQYVQSHNFGLFDHPIREHNRQLNLYQVKIPGVREYAPRIDLGDVLLIRPLQPVLQATIAHEAQKWSQRRDDIAPGFGGMEHHAVVWSIMRRDEIVIVKLGQPLHGDTRDLRCNVIIPLQAHKNAPAWRAIDMATSNLNDRSRRLWLHSMLFPDMNDGILQTTLSRGTFDLTWYDESLNFEQKRSVQAVVDNDYGVLPYLISGPPGTGKTKTLVEAAIQLISAQQTDIVPHLLLCAPSDSAADTLLVRLSEHLSPSKLFRLNNWTRLLGEVPGEVRSYCYIDEATNLYSLPAFEKIMSYQIVVTSCRDANMLLAAGLSNDNLTSITSSLLRTIAPNAVPRSPPLHWTALLLDEAAQATEPEALIPITVVQPPKLIPTFNVPQVVMAGDEYQLGPRLVSTIILSSPDDVYTNSSFPTPQLDKSLFQRLFETRLYSAHPLSRAHGLRPLSRSMLPIIRPPFANLIRNYRSHPAILSTSSHLFYADTLIPERPDVDPAILSWPRWPSRHRNTWPVMFVQNTSEDSVESVTEGDGTGAGSLINKQEARIALEMVQNLLFHVNNIHQRRDGNTVLHEDEIIVMSPYRAQVTYLRTLFRSASLHAVRIGPLEAFQGLESRIVVLCTTRTRLGSRPHLPRKFVDEDLRRGLGVVDEEKRFNVAMTRAREGLVVIGSAECLRVTGDRCWGGAGGGLLGFVERNGLVSRKWGGGGLPGGFLGRGRINRGIGKLEKALVWREGLGNEENMDSRGSDAYGTANGKSSTETNENFKFRLMGRMVDLDERMWEMQVGDQEEETLRQEEDTCEDYAIREVVDSGVRQNVDDDDQEDNDNENYDKIDYEAILEEVNSLLGHGK